MLLKALGVPAEQAAYVGDDPAADIAGANAAGMQSIWFDWEGRAYPAEIAPPTRVIHALDELLGFLQG
jgi:putative hydrolase of the HAD superfamily